MGSRYRPCLVFLSSLFPPPLSPLPSAFLCPGIPLILLPLNDDMTMQIENFGFFFSLQGTVYSIAKKNIQLSRKLLLAKLTFFHKRAWYFSQIRQHVRFLAWSRLPSINAMEIDVTPRFPLPRHYGSKQGDFET